MCKFPWPPDKLSVFIYSAILGMGLLCQALRQGDLGSKTGRAILAALQFPHLSNGKISCLFQGHVEKYVIVGTVSRYQVQQGPGARSQAPGFASNLCHLPPG